MGCAVGSGNFGVNPQPQGRLNVVGIFDQEDDQVSPYTGGYRVWVKKAADISAALDACREAGARDAGERVALAGKVVSRVFDGFFFIQDEGRSGGVRVISSRAVSPGEIVSVAGVIVEDQSGRSDRRELCEPFVRRAGASPALRQQRGGSRRTRAERSGPAGARRGRRGRGGRRGRLHSHRCVGHDRRAGQRTALRRSRAAVIVTAVAVGSGDGAALVAAGPEDIELVTQ